MRKVLLTPLVLLVAGLLGSWWVVARADRELRQELVGRTRLLAEAMDPGQLKVLTGTAADVGAPGYERLKRQFLVARQDTPQCRFLYLLGRRADQRIFFLLDSEPVNSADYSPPGQSFEEVTAECARVFETKAATVEGPVVDRWGTWVSALVPMIDPDTGGVVALLGMGWDAREWKWRLARRALPPLLFTMALVVIQGAGAWLLARRARSSGVAPHWMRWTEPVWAAAIGGTLTLAATWLAHDRETYQRQDEFAQLAGSRTGVISTALRHACDSELESLARFCETADPVVAADFQRFTTGMTRNSAVQAWEWVPVIPATDQARVEAALQETGRPGLALWQKDAHGRRVAATGRETYYPVLLVAPEAGNEAAVGYDLGSDPLRRQALEEAVRTGLPTATDPLTLVQEGASQKGMLICRPVFSREAPQRLRGFAVAVLRLGSFVAHLAPETATPIRLTLVRRDAPAVVLANTNAERPWPDPAFAFPRPHFFAGQNLVVTAQAGPEFLRTHPLTMQWIILLTGLLLTITTAGVIGLIVHRREKLQELVLARTAELQESEGLQRLLLESIDAGVIIIDAATHIIERVNRKAAELFGVTEPQITGRQCHCFICPAETGRCPITDRGQEVNNSERVLVRADGSHLPILKSARRIQINGQAKILETFIDIFARKQAEEALHESEANFRAFFETIGDMLLVAAADGRIIFSNTALRRKLGYSAAELEQKHILDLHPPANCREAGEIFAAMLGGERQSCPLPLIARNGTLVPVETRIWRGRWNSADSIFGISKDLSAEQEAQQRFERLFRNNPALMALSILPERTFYDVNDAFLKTLGYAKGDVLGKSATDLGLFPHPEQRAAVMERLRLEGRFADCELQIRRKDGTLLDGLFSGEVINSQGQQYLLSVMIDLTARKAAETQLREHAAIERLMATLSARFINLSAAETDRAIQESLGEVGAMMRVDRVYVFMYTPDLAFCSNTHEWCSAGTSPQIANLQAVPSAALPWWTAAMRRFESIVIPDVAQLPAAAAAERELLAEQGIQSLLVVPMVWGGNLEGFVGFDAVARAQAWEQEDVVPLELLASIIINALKRKQGEERLQATQQALRELNVSLEQRVEERTRQLQETQTQLFLQDKMASVGQLAAGMAHEINNPIGFVSTNFATLEEDVRILQELLAGYQELATAAVAAAPALQERVAGLRRQEEELSLGFMLRDLPNLFAESRDGFRRVSSIINSMRNFARRDTVGEFQPFNLNRGVEDTLVLARNSYKYNAEIKLELGELPDIFCVPGQINQVLLNLIVNAGQALAGAPGHGRGVITIRTRNEAEQVICEVEDNGPGIPAGRERQIFDPFFTTKPPGEGTGLGLSISYTIVVVKHGGTFTAANVPGSGACFRITLPHHPPAAARSATDGA